MLIGAGSDTTSTVLQNFFKVMALHPHVTASAQKGSQCLRRPQSLIYSSCAELDTVVGRSRLPVWADQMDLPYCRALIKEVHRWAPIGSLGKHSIGKPLFLPHIQLKLVGVPHGITEDILYEGQFIPKDTIVMPNLVTLNRDQDRYNDAETFDPPRFLDDRTDAFTSALSADPMQRDHFHYGFGRRLCQGIHFAEDSLFIAISRILWAYNIKQLPEYPLSMADKICE